ncbi:hypothetical protein IAQ67_28515 (plasmid) [Paenibacillus peoriae]|uniref:Uncharacterized protein n=1 Tax=Paenibacillus peoriae TaxID=59893 RepID=A0A7H0YH99_9BACL|nr:hypothetical protein [Paenibacillus peoriae]QNR70457.1 hypothetical protein IAQ67_28515 [Paenibacillus peoriae]
MTEIEEYKKQLNGYFDLIVAKSLEQKIPNEKARRLLTKLNEWKQHNTARLQEES